MAILKFTSVFAILGLVLMANGNPVKVDDTNKSFKVESDQLASGTVSQAAIPDSEVSATNAKGDLKTSDSFGLGYYYPVVTPALVKYHYPLLYYPTAYLHSLRHHGFGGYGFHHHGVGIIH